MLIVTVEIRGVEGGAQGAKEAVAMALEGLGGARVTEVRCVGDQMALDGTGARPEPDPPTPRPRDGERKAGRRGSPFRACLNCGARSGEPGTLVGGKLAYGVCAVSLDPVRDLHGLCPRWTAGG